MKKLIAIALLSLQMFTICGHMLLYQYFVYQSDSLFNEQISKHRYNVNDLVEIKLAGHTSLFKNWDNFESVTGQVQFKNTCYNYVKLKLTADTIYLMCVPNYEKTRLYNQNIINARHIDDVPINKKEHVPFGKTIDLGKYNYSLTLYNFSPAVTEIQTADIFLTHNAIQHYIAVPEQPPKMLS